MTPAQPAPAMPALTMHVPTGVHDAFADARERARRDTASWLAAHPSGTALEFRSFIVEQAGAPPTGAAAEADHATVKAAVAARTPEQDDEARWIDEYGLFIPWQPATNQYIERVGADQAKAGVALLQKAEELTGVLTFPIKDRHMRERPFQEHADTPLLSGLTHVHGGSFPSGHASLAFAQEAVLTALLPDRRAQLQRLAEQLSFSRSYAAAHYPTDIVTGAYVGAAAAAFVQARPDAEIPARDRH
jgi:acid phosphatase (class A)